MKRIYVAGPIRSKNPVKFLLNIAKGLFMTAYLIIHKYAVFSPFLDFQLLLGPYGEDVTEDMLQANSLAFVECCHVMLVLNGWEDSEGAKKEIKRAKELGIPVYYDRAKMEKEIEA